MILFFEGFDRTGKSTLLQRMKNVGYQTFRSTKQINSDVNLELAIQYDWRFMLDFLSQVNLNVCFDRTFISQYVYSVLYRLDKVQSYYTVTEYKKIFDNYCDFLNKLNYKIIYCYREDFSNAYDEHINLSDAKFAHKLYIDFLKNLKIIECKFENGVDHNFNLIKGLL